MDDFKREINGACSKMELLNCKCDRKEHVVNSRIKESGAFNDIT